MLTTILHAVLDAGFEQLLPQPHNKVVMDLLFVLCTWHACGKLRLHTEMTLVFFKETMKSFSQVLQQFSRLPAGLLKQKSCPEKKQPMVSKRVLLLQRGNHRKIRSLGGNKVWYESCSTCVLTNYMHLVTILWPSHILAHWITI